VSRVTSPDRTCEGVSVSLDGGVGTIEFSRPPANYFTVALVTEIVDAMDALASDSQCRIVVLKSAGRHFCAGAELTGPVAPAAGPHLYDVAARIFDQPLPIVAAIQGAAIGGGFGLALAADFRVACPEARFAANFARLGFHHGFAMSVTLPAVVGQQAALDLLYTGRRVDGREAFRLGICDRLADTDSLDEATRDLARAIAASAPLAIRSIRYTMRAELAQSARRAMERERAEQTRLMATADFSEGVAATAERRIPVFHGR
jgi:2-(1,2-epoxy-1,2-dihydrophenyl)acetyl-CoA isomerase